MNAATQWDARSGQTWDNEYNVAGNSAQSGLYPGPNQYQYDSSGRQTQDLFTSSEFGQQYSYNRTYDAENHPISAPTGPSCNISSSQCLYPNANLTWGPDGQLRGVCQNPSGSTCAQSMDLHWDGSTLLFESTKPQGGAAATVLYVGKVGVTYNGGGFAVVDRNQSGIQETWHTQTAFGPWNGFSFNMVGSGGRAGISVWLATNWGSCYNQGAYGGCLGQGAYAPDIGMDRADGYTYASFAVQGARTYDSTSQQWLTPDAYAGSVHSPMSQKPFMWSNNNPSEWADPTGYVAEVTATPSVDNPQTTNVTITLYVTFTGAGANAQTESAVINAIESTWSGTVGNYNVTTTVVTDTAGVPKNEMNTIDISTGGKSDPTDVDMLNNVMRIGSDTGDTYGIAHEAGRLMGLGDMYDQVHSILGVQNPNFGKAFPGHEGDIMATNGGSVTTYDIQQILATKGLYP